MANILKNLLDYLKLSDEDDDYDLYEEEFDERESTRARRQERMAVEREQKSEKATVKLDKKNNTRQLYTAKPVEDEDTSETVQVKRQRQVKTERTSSNKIVPIRTTPMGLEVCIMKPASFEDSQDICDMLLTGRAVVVNLEGFDAIEAQRIMDFISGSVYAINGKLHQISRYIFIFSPDSIDISGDYLELMPEDGFEVPTLNKEF